ncbi:MAG: helix-turn-helix domain-containing protein [Anaerolineae bacterium]|nr:helix-turn-helix domain-containing protein [Anaerolineae bacterium]
MESVTPDTQSAADEARQWQIKWGTPGLVSTEHAQVRAYGHLDIHVIAPQQLAACLNVQDGQELVQTARSRLKEMAVQALQAALDEQDLLSFPDHVGSLAPEYIEQVMACASAALQTQLAAMGLELGAFVIEGNSYQHQLEHSDLITGGDDCAGCRAIRRQLGLETPSESPPPGLGSVPALGIKMEELMMQTMSQPTGAPPSPASLYPDQMTPAQVAAHLQIAEADVLQLIESDQLKSIKIGSQHRISKAQLEEYLRS